MGPCIPRPIELLFGSVAFCGGRKAGEPGEKQALGARTNNKLNPHMTPGSESNPGHTALFLLPSFAKVGLKVYRFSLQVQVVFFLHLVKASRRRKR